MLFDYSFSISHFGALSKAYSSISSRGPGPSGTHQKHYDYCFFATRAYFRGLSRLLYLHYFDYCFVTGWLRCWEPPADGQACCYDLNYFWLFLNARRSRVKDRHYHSDLLQVSTIIIDRHQSLYWSRFTFWLRSSFWTFTDVLSWLFVKRRSLVSREVSWELIRLHAIDADLGMLTFLSIFWMGWKTIDDFLLQNSVARLNLWLMQFP